jgi:GxxExxY protein
MKLEEKKTGKFHDGSEEIIGAAIEVHQYLGPGLLESIYEECLCREFSLRGIPFERQVPVPVIYKGWELDQGYRIDLVANRIVVEVKAVERVLRVHEAQAITYLRLMNLPTALLLNFGCATMKDGIRRLYGPS